MPVESPSQWYQAMTIDPTTLDKSAGPSALRWTGETVGGILLGEIPKEKTMAHYSGPDCARCGVQACGEGTDARRRPDFCPGPAEAELLQNVERIYMEKDEVRILAAASARTEAAGYGRMTRIEDIMDFARRIGARKLGLAHCIGLMREAQTAEEIFIAGGFEVASVCCKVGSIPKEKIGLLDEDKVHPGGFEALCSPIGQAELLSKAGTQLNVVIGLCVGHDSLFFMHSRVPATVLIAKDRVLGHNPVACLYTSHSYYKRLTETK
jgi:uncharacterized metal-binding protein